jgi:hypothetical protein
MELGRAQSPLRKVFAHPARTQTRQNGCTPIYFGVKPSQTVKRLPGSDRNEMMDDLG